MEAVAVNDLPEEDVSLRPDEVVCPVCHYTYHARQPACTNTCKAEW